MKQVDARGLSCPQPVLEAKAAIQDAKPSNLMILVDSEAAQQNVQRFLESQGYQTRLERNQEDYIVSANRDSGVLQTGSDSYEVHCEASKKILVFCSSDRIGFGNPELGKKLMINYLRTIKELGDDLWRLVLVNAGVKLAVNGSEVLQDLQAYENGGRTILVCGTCLAHYKLLDQKQVGQVTNMLDIVTAMQLADKVISL